MPIKIVGKLTRILNHCRSPLRGDCCSNKRFSSAYHSPYRRRNVTGNQRMGPVSPVSPPLCPLVRRAPQSPEVSIEEVIRRPAGKHPSERSSCPGIPYLGCNQRGCAVACVAGRTHCDQLGPGRRACDRDRHDATQRAPLFFHSSRPARAGRGHPWWQDWQLACFRCGKHFERSGLHCVQTTSKLLSPIGRPG